MEVMKPTLVSAPVLVKCFDGDVLYLRYHTIWFLIIDNQLYTLIEIYNCFVCEFIVFFAGVYTKWRSSWSISFWLHSWRLYHWLLIWTAVCSQDFCFYFSDELIFFIKCHWERFLKVERDFLKTPGTISAIWVIIWTVVINLC